MIEEWHYFLISYYNSNTKFYNDDIVKICKKEGLEFLFYDPKKHIFYDNKFNEYKKLKLTFNSNLDYNKDNSTDLIFENFYNISSNFYDYCKISVMKNNLIISAINFVNKITNKIELKEIINNLKRKNSNFLKLNLIALYHYSRNLPFPIPNNNYLLLFLNKEKNDYVYYYKENNLFHSGYLIKKEDLSPFFISAYIDNDLNNSSFLVYKFINSK